MPEVLYEMEALETISISDNKVESFDAVRLCGLSRLSTLDLQNNNLSALNPLMGRCTQLQWATVHSTSFILFCCLIASCKNTNSETVNGLGYISESLESLIRIVYHWLKINIIVREACLKFSWVINSDNNFYQYTANFAGIASWRATHSGIQDSQYWAKAQLLCLSI